MIYNRHEMGRRRITPEKPMIKIYKIHNFTDMEDKNFYIGSTKQKYLSARWSHHTREARDGLDRKLYNHMRSKGIDNFKCDLLYTCTCEGNDIKSLEKKFISELKPTLQEKNNTQTRLNLKEYQKEYHKSYHPIYYNKNKDRLKMKMKEYSEANKDRLKRDKKKRNDAIRLAKTHYCSICDIAFTNASSLKNHQGTNHHKNKAKTH